MTRTLTLLGLLTLSAVAISAQTPSLQDPLLDRMVGKWVLQGTIGGSATTHDVDVDWVLGHQYIRLHEVSRERTDKGQPAYEAIVFIGWDESSRTYACLWLDSTGGGGLSAQTFGHAKRGADELAFVFKTHESVFHTTFVYDKATATWRWLMDDERAGKFEPFARVTLSSR